MSLFFVFFSFLCPFGTSRKQCDTFGGHFFAFSFVSLCPLNFEYNEELFVDGGGFVVWIERLFQDSAIWKRKADGDNRGE